MIIDIEVINMSFNFSLKLHSILENKQINKDYFIVDGGFVSVLQISDKMILIYIKLN